MHALDLRNVNGMSSETFILQPHRSFYQKFSPEVKKCIINSGTSNQISKKSFFTFQDIDLRNFHAKLHKRPNNTLGADSI